MSASLEYLAGFFDGEGYIGVVHESTNKRYGLRACVYNNVPLGPTMFAERFGGKIQQRKQRGRLIESWYWLVQGRNAKKFLREIRPYLNLKAQEADLALQFPIVIERSQATSETKEIQRQIYEQLQAIKTGRSQIEERVRKTKWKSGLEERPEVQRAIELYTSGLPMEKVSSQINIEFPELNTTHANVSYWMRATGNNISRKDAHTRAWKTKEKAIGNRPETQQAKEMYQAGKSVKEICEALGEKEMTIYYWLRKMGITRPLSESQKLRRQREKE